MAYYKQTSATAQVKVGAGKLKSLTVSSTSSGTIKFYDSAQSSTSDPVIINTLTPSAGAVLNWGPEGLQFDEGLYAVIANTLEVTIGFE